MNEETSDPALQPQAVTEVTADKIEMEMMRPVAEKEAAGFTDFIGKTKCPAFLIVAIDTVPDEKGQHAIYRGALGSADALLSMFVYLQSEVMPKLAESPDKEEIQRG